MELLRQASGEAAWDFQLFSQVRCQNSTPTLLPPATQANPLWANPLWANPLWANPVEEVWADSRLQQRMTGFVYLLVYFLVFVS